MLASQTSGTANAPVDWASLCRALLQHSPLPMATVEGADHLVRFMNPAFCRLLGRSSEAVTGRPFAELLPAENECLTLLDEVWRNGIPATCTQRQPTQPHWAYSMWPIGLDGVRVGVMVQVTQTLQFHEKTLAMNEALMAGSVRQHHLATAAQSLNEQLRARIAERIQAETALRISEAALRSSQEQINRHAENLEKQVTQRTQELTASNQQLETFVYSIAHDLRAPLRALQGYAVLLVEEAGAALTDSGKDYAERINKSAQFMDALLKGLLVFSRISQQPIELTAVDLRAIVASVLASLDRVIQETHAQVEVPGPWPAVLAHEATLVQILFNLVSNALKFVTPGVPPVVRLRTETQTTLVRVWVEDNGPGIDPRHQDQIFRLFTRLDREKSGGTGLGLAIVLQGVARLGGEVGVESTPGQGSRFWFAVKAAKASDSLPCP